MKYLDHTLGIGQKLFVGLENLSLEHRILTTWSMLESIVCTVGYDVFLPIAPAHDQMQKLVQFCYAPIFEGTPEGDLDELRRKNAEYGESWCRRGGVGAFFMLARKADRFETQIKKYGTLEKAISESKHTTENILDTVGDLRRYLLLVLSWHEMKDKERNEPQEAFGPHVFQGGAPYEACVICGKDPRNSVHTVGGPIAIREITAQTIEDVGAQLEEQFKRSLCKRCGHHKEKHSLCDSGYQDACVSESCVCLGFSLDS